MPTRVRTLKVSSGIVTVLPKNGLVPKPNGFINGKSNGVKTTTVVTPPKKNGDDARRKKALAALLTIASIGAAVVFGAYQAPPALPTLYTWTLDCDKDQSLDPSVGYVTMKDYQVKWQMPQIYAVGTSYTGYPARAPIFGFGEKFSPSEIGTLVTANLTLRCDTASYYVRSASSPFYDPTLYKAYTVSVYEIQKPWKESTPTDKNNVSWNDIKGNKFPVNKTATSFIVVGKDYVFPNTTIPGYEGPMPGWNPLPPSDQIPPESNVTPEDIGPPLQWAPTFVSTPITTVNVSSPYSYTALVNETAVTWSYSPSTWLHFTSANHTIWGRAPATPQTSKATIYCFSQRGGLWASQSWDIKVKDLPVPPPPEGNVHHDVNLTFNVTKAIQDWKNGKWKPSNGFLVAIQAPWQTSNITGMTIINYQFYANHTGAVIIIRGYTTVIPEFPLVVGSIAMVAVILIIGRRGYK